MISVSKLVCNTESFGDTLRYNKDSKGTSHGTTCQKGPVVVWNCTKTCNLNCIHCYASASAENEECDGELTTKEGKTLIENLKAYNVPVLLISGGEPLMRDDILYLAKYANNLNIRTTFSTNGTLITKQIAKQLKEAGTSYVGISIDGIGETNDSFRGQNGAFDKAVRGIENCLSVGQRVGLRFTINKRNLSQLPGIFTLIKDIAIPRACFYHLVYSGRGSSLIKEDISLQEARETMELIIDHTRNFQSMGLDKEILTVANHADGIYLYLKLKNEDPVKAKKAWELLKNNGGNRTGMAISSVDWNGNVHPDQFTANYTIGNVRKKPFGEIWSDKSNKILLGLRNRKSLLKGRCSKCQWLDICNGNVRVRAEAVYEDLWQSDPACYLSDLEIGLQ
ncbi:MAG: radical SAM protein [Desulfitibacter sp. BRH_c19]|nr:MAG: radical SAM protein [Desulfitibacter sp. BRH_c19]